VNNKSEYKSNKMDYFLCLMILVVSIILGYALLGGCQCQSTLKMVLLILSIYLVLHIIIDYINPKRNQDDSIPLVPLTPSIIVNDSVNKAEYDIESEDISLDKRENPEISIEEDHIKVNDMEYPIMGELDHIDPYHLIKNVKTIYKNTKTNYPFIPDNHQSKSTGTEFTELDNGISPSKEEKYLKIASKYYPQLTETQLNYADCTNFDASDERSCIIPKDNLNLRPIAKTKQEFEPTLVTKEMLSKGVQYIIDAHDINTKEGFQNIPDGTESKLTSNLSNKCDINSSCSDKLCLPYDKEN
jgi:hypothetical protein